MGSQDAKVGKYKNTLRENYIFIMTRKQSKKAKKQIHAKYTIIQENSHVIERASGVIGCEGRKSRGAIPCPSCSYPGFPVSISVMKDFLLVDPCPQVAK